MKVALVVFCEAGWRVSFERGGSRGFYEVVCKICNAGKRSALALGQPYNTVLVVVYNKTALSAVLLEGAWYV